MDSTEILSLPAGRELDLRVGVGIGAFVPAALAWLDDPKMMEYLRDGEECPLPHYSTDIAAALLVLSHPHLFDGWKLEQGMDGGWHAYANAWYADCVSAFGETLPLAICRAALLVAASPGFAQHRPPRPAILGRRGSFWATASCPRMTTFCPRSRIIDSSGRPD